jgi:hypothetical protein
VPEVFTMSEPNGSSSLSVRLVTGVLLVIMAGVACGSHSVLVPPRLNLVPYGQVGLVTFTAENAKGSLHEFATRRFSEYLLAAQTGIEVLELGAADSVLRRTHTTELGPAAAQGLGGERGVPVVFFGHLKVSNVKPSGGLVQLAVPRLEATVSAELSVELLSTKSGGTLWRSSAAATEKVAGLALVDGQPVFSAKDPNDAYGQLVNRLVYAVTYDLRSTWVKQ